MLRPNVIDLARQPLGNTRMKEQFCSYCRCGVRARLKETTNDYIQNFITYIPLKNTNTVKSPVSEAKTFN